MYQPPPQNISRQPGRLKPPHKRFWFWYIRQHGGVQILLGLLFLLIAVPAWFCTCASVAELSGLLPPAPSPTAIAAKGPGPSSSQKPTPTQQIALPSPTPTHAQATFTPAPTATPVPPTPTATPKPTQPHLGETQTAWIAFYGQPAKRTEEYTPDHPWYSITLSWQPLPGNNYHLMATFTKGVDKKTLYASSLSMKFDPIVAWNDGVQQFKILLPPDANQQQEYKDSMWITDYYMSTAVGKTFAPEAFQAHAGYDPPGTIKAVYADAPYTTPPHTKMDNCYMKLGSN